MKRALALSVLLPVLTMGTVIFAAPVTDGDAEDAEGVESTESAESTEKVYIPQWYLKGENINNKEDNADHKISQDKFDYLWKHWYGDTTGKIDITANAPLQEGRRYFHTGDVNDSDSYYVSARTYLIENEILERPVSVTVDTSGTSVVQEYAYWLEKDQPVKASDLNVMLYKSVYGTIDSRLLYRDVVTEPTETALDYYEVYQFYTNPTVYELYLQSAMEKGLVSKNDLSNMDLTSSRWDSTDYTWSNTKEPLGLNVKIDASGYATSLATNVNGIWGSAYDYKISDTGITISPKGTTVGVERPSFFVSEDMTLLEVLQTVEKYLRLTEKDMSETEADLVAYKYGITYLKELSDVEHDTVAFLIAKGIINFEDTDLGYFETATWNEVLPILYRAANPDARYDFSAIQLTDGETFWQAKGFGNDEFTLYVPKDNNVIMQTVSVEEVATELSVVGWLQSMFSVNASTSLKTYKITKDFDVGTSNKYYYKGTLITELEGDYTKFSEIKSITRPTDGDYNADVLRIVFNIKATSETRAIQILDDNLSATIANAASYYITGVTKIERNGQEIRMISQSVLKKCFGDKIDFVEDKVLVNVDTGAMACLLQDAGYALVGNQVFVNENILVTASDATVYYNFEVVASLLGLSITELYKDSVNTTMVSFDLIDGTVKLYSSSGIQTGTAEYILGWNAGTEDNPMMRFTGKQNSNYQFYYNVNQISNGLNTVYRIFYDDDYKQGATIVLVDWQYVVPSTDSINTENLLPESAVTVEGVTWDDVFNALYTAPESGTALRAWWDSNLSMSQGLMRMFFGNQRTNFVQCGYLVPSVTVLLSPYADETSLKAVSKQLVNFGFAVDNEYSSYFGGTTSNFLSNYSKGKGLNSHASLAALASQYKTVTVIKGTKYKNGEGTVYGDEFYLDNNSVLYRNVNSDTLRLSCKTGGSELSSITINDRTKGEVAVPTVGTTITIGTGSAKRSYYFNGLVSKTVGSKVHQYYDLIPVYDGAIGSLPEFSISSPSKNGNKSAIYIKIGSYDSWGEQVAKEFYEPLGLTEPLITKDDWLYNELYNSAGKDTFALNKSTANYYRKLDSGKMYGLYYDGDLGGYKAKSTTWKIKPSTKICYGIPHVFLPSGSFYLKNNSGDWGIAMGKTSSLINRVSFYYSGILQSVIDAIIANYVGTTSIGDLDDGTILYVGNTKWVKSGDVWDSYPIKDTITAKKAKKGGNATAAFQQYFGSMAVVCDGYSVPFKNYVSEVSLGRKYLNKLPNKAVCVTQSPTGEVHIVKKTSQGTSTVKSSVTASYTCFQVQFKDALLVRPLTSDHSVYSVCFSASERMVSGISSLFLDEDLSYVTEDSKQIDVSQNGYEETSAFLIEADEFEQEYQKRWYEDFKTLMCVLIAFIAGYLTVISWLVYLSVSTGTALWLLESIAAKERSTGKKHGVDLVKIFSFGVYNLDSPPTLSRMVVVTIVCLFIITACSLMI